MSRLSSNGKAWGWQNQSGNFGPIPRTLLNKAMANPLALKVDVDTLRRPSCRELSELLQKANRVLLWLVERRSPSGRGWHRWIGVWPRPQTAVETVALQLLCGSDPHREAYNLNRAKLVDAKEVSPYWRTRWNTFYRHEQKHA